MSSNTPTRGPNKTRQPAINNAESQASAGTSNRTAVSPKRKRPPSVASNKTSLSKTKTAGERGLTPGAVPYLYQNAAEGKVAQSKQSSSKGITAVREWLEDLQKQTESGNYNLEAFTKMSEGYDTEIAKCAEILKQICNTLKRKSDQSGTNLHRTKGNDSRVNDAAGNAELAKAKINAVTEWLLKLEDQIGTCKYDVTDFTQNKFTDGSHNEMNKCNNVITDICNKLKNQTNDRRSADTELKLLVKEIESWNYVKSIETGQETADEMTKTIRASRLQILEKKKEFKSADVEMKLLANEIKTWNTVEAIENETGMADGMAKTVRTSRLQLLEKKTEVNSADAELKLLGKEIKAWNDLKTIESGQETAHEMTKTVRTSRLQILEKKKEFSSAEGEMKLLEKDLKAWNDVKTIENTKGMSDGMTKVIRTSRLQLLVKKKELSSNKDSKKGVTTDLNKQEHSIKKIWKITFPDKANSEKLSANTALDELEKYALENKEKLEKLTKLRDKLETEISELQKEIENFNEVPECPPKNVDANSANILHTIRQARVRLYNKKKEINEDLKISAENKEKQDSSLQKHAVTLWKIAFGTEVDLSKFGNGNDGRKNGMVQIFEDVTAEFKNLENVSSKLGVIGHSIYENVIGVIPPVTDIDQLNGSVKVLQNTLQNLQRCQEETGTFVKSFSELAEVLVPEGKHESISKTCKVITTTAKTWKKEYEGLKSYFEKSLQALNLAYSELISEPYGFPEPRTNMESIKRYPEWFQDIALAINRIRGCTKENKESFQKKFVKVDIYDKLNAERKELLDAIDKLRVEKDDALNRLSKLAGARLTDNNPNIADLSDPNRPTRLAEQYSELYDTPWTDAYETLKLDERDCINFLLEILVGCYKISGDISVNHQKILNRVICNPTEGIGPERKATKQKDKENSSTLSAVQSKALSELRKQSADLSVISVKAHIQAEHKEWFKPKKLEKYTFLCIELCWLMHVQSPPVFLETSIKAGSPFDTSRYKQYTKGGKKVDYLVWPALLLQEGGAMLSKGVAQGK